MILQGNLSKGGLQLLLVVQAPSLQQLGQHQYNQIKFEVEIMLSDLFKKNNFQLSLMYIKTFSSGTSVIQFLQFGRVQKFLHSTHSPIRLSNYSYIMRFQFKKIVLMLLLLGGCQTTATQPSSTPANNPVNQQPLPVTSPSVESTVPQPIQSTAQATPYPRRPYELRDQVPSNSSFHQFRERLKQAIRDRDAGFIEAIADPNIQITFGIPVPFSSLGFDDPNSLSWKRLERIINIGCTPYEAPAGVEMGAYQCPHVSQASLGDPFSDVYIVGENINVRAQPSPDSPVMDVLSDEVVKSDPDGLDRLTPQQREEQQTDEGWQPVITPTGQRGYVSSRYAYYPAGYRARFENKQGQWKITAFIAGD